MNKFKEDKEKKEENYFFSGLIYYGFVFLIMLILFGLCLLPSTCS